MTPSEVLNAAADRVRDLAAVAVPGPWDSALAEVDHAGPYEREMVADCGDSRTADWIAALSPAVAPHIEAWLRHSAGTVKAIVEGSGWPANGSEAAAFRFAKAILGSVPEGTGGTT